MLRWKVIKTIFSKELYEVFRDKRTILTSVLVPILMYPLLTIGLTRLQDSEEAATKARKSVLAVWGNAPTALLNSLDKEKFEIKVGAGLTPEIEKSLREGTFAPIPTAPEDDEGFRKFRKETEKHPLVVAGREFVLSRQVDAVMVVFPNVADSLVAQTNQQGGSNISVLFDSVRTASSSARDRLNFELAEFNRTVLQQRETSAGLASGFTKGITVSGGNVAPLSRSSGFQLGAILPFMLIFTSVTGAMLVAIDTTAGEKERNTMQTLLAAPLRPEETAFGKFLAIWAVGLATSTLNVLSLAFTFSTIMKGAGAMQIGPEKFLIAFLMLLPITMLASALFLSIGAFAKDVKEAQSYLTPACTTLGLPSSVSMIPGIELNQWNMFAPILNITLLMKSLLTGEAKPDAIFLVLLSSFAYAALGVMFAARVFARENILVGGQDSWAGIFGLERGKSLVPSASLALVTFAFVLVANFYFQTSMLGQIPFESLLLTSQYGLFLLPPVALIAAFRFSWFRTLPFHVPNWKAILAAVLLGLSLWAVAMQLSQWLIPIPGDFAKGMQKVLLMEDKKPSLWLLIFLIGITPAICEEILFRGFIQTGLSRMGVRLGILGTAFLFAVAHSSIYRMIPTLLLGLAMCFAMHKSRSLITSMLLHGINNSFMVVLATQPEVLKQLGVTGETEQLPVPLLVGAALASGLGIFLLWSLREPQPSDTIVA
jgi:sodium transport system permease protein